MPFLLFAAACFLAYSNGANDNIKGVASLFGSSTTNYRTAIWWATVTTFAGSLSSIFLAQALVKTFSGKGLVPDQIVGSEHFLLAVGVGAGLTVITATLLGFPISTTHALTGAIIGTGLMAAGKAVRLRALGSSFLLPLTLSPALAVILAVFLYLFFRWLRLRLGVTKNWCVCIGETEQLVPIPRPASIMAMQAAAPALTVVAGEQPQCLQRYAGRFIGLEAQQLMDSLHFLSAGAVGFARGLNDTPKVASILLASRWLDIGIGMVALALAIAIGGLLNASKVAETMSPRITAMNHGQGLAANVATSILVTARTHAWRWTSA
jgi:PiT family inorganic phosphate transporter